MDVKEYERIKGLIKKSEIESAKAQGVIDNIKKEWRDKYGTDDVDEIKAKFEKMEDERKNLESKLNSVYEKLVDSYDWDDLEEKLNA